MQKGDQEKPIVITINALPYGLPCILTFCKVDPESRRNPENCARSKIDWHENHDLKHSS